MELDREGRAEFESEGCADVETVESLERLAGVDGVWFRLAQLLLLLLMLLRVHVLKEGREEGVETLLVLCTRLWLLVGLKLLGGAIFDAW